MFNKSTIAEAAIPSIAKVAWNKTILNAIGANKTKANGIAFLVINKTPIKISKTPNNGNMTPVTASPFIYTAASPCGGGIGKKLANLLTPKMIKIKAKTILSTIVNFEFIIITDLN